MQLTLLSGDATRALGEHETLLPSSGRSGAECPAPNPQLDFCWLGDAAELELGFTEAPGNTEHHRGTQRTLSAS